MGAKYTMSQANATAKYMQDKHTIRVVVDNDKLKKYKDIAQEKGLSLNKFIIQCIESQI